MGNELDWSERKLNPLNTRHREESIPRNFRETRTFERPVFFGLEPEVICKYSLGGMRNMI
jgi:hypothetical protein